MNQPSLEDLLDGKAFLSEEFEHHLQKLRERSGPYTCPCGEKIDETRNKDSSGMLLWGRTWKHIYKEIAERFHEIVVAAHVGEPSRMGS